MSISVTTLPNGLRVCTDRVDTVQTVSLGAWVDVGTRHEPAAINGISHLLEHMAFKGTETRSAKAIAEEIENVGGMLNAYTSRENTAYYAKVLKEDAGLATDIVADILQHSVFDPEELAREQAVVVQEINQAEDTPDDIIFDHWQAAAYPNQPLGRPVLGTEDIVTSLTRDTLIDFMRKRYTAPHIVLSASGNIEHDAFVDMVAKAFENLPTNAGAPEEDATYTGGEYREDRDLEQAHVVLGFDGVRYDDPDFYGIQVLSQLLGGGMSSRLFQEIREKRGLVYSIYSFTWSYRDSGLFGIYAGTGEKEVAELVPVMTEEILKVGQSVDAAELARAKAQLKAGMLMGMESTSNRCEQLARQLLAFGRPISVEEMAAAMDAVTVEDMTRLARRMVQTPLTMAALGPLDKLESFDSVKTRLAA
ncbi:M16 family metallopeptidase [Caenispirillum bisanense]|uniref:Predicted Zn-dependent peptidase n=1 Tax=Caenispirillum bisanense TaxID=414052 RepID=A0A286GW15_9PROT|nr:pitrilysin family protein [Caenispirillum bisanense]SOD99735.1 Predicted Zn-dependent peptidase [Caenispirillum bisanense]